MTQSRDYFEDCTVLAPYSPPSACCNYVPQPCCSNYSNCCEKLPCVVRTIYRTPVCVARCVSNCCDNFCKPCSSCCCEYPCKPVTCRRGRKKKVVCCDDDCCENGGEAIRHWILGMVLLAAFAILIVSFNHQLMLPPKRRFFM